MAKPRAQTLQQRFGFQDNDLLTPAHDQIMIDADANLESIIKAHFFKPGWPIQTIKKATSFFDIAKRDTLEAAEKRLNDFSDSGPPDSDEYWRNYRREMIDREQTNYDLLSTWDGLGSPPDKPDMQIIESIWEYPVQSGTKYIIGFIDLQVSWTDYRLNYIWHGRHHHNTDGRQVTILDLDKQLPAWSIDSFLRTLHIEVKTKIPSVGELLRQIQMYKTHRPGRYMVISPDDRFKAQIEAQGLTFLKYLGGTEEPIFEFPQCQCVDDQRRAS